MRESDLLPVLHSPMLVGTREGQAKFAVSGRERGFFKYDMRPQTMPLKCSSDGLSRNYTPAGCRQNFCGR